MNRVVRAGIAALGFLGLCVSALSARAQDEDDVIKKHDKSTQAGKIKSEDLKGCTVTITKADVTLSWKDIKSIQYAGSPELRKARALVEAGNTAESIPLLEDVRKKSDLRGILKPHVMNLLGASYVRAGEFDRAVEVYTELFKQFPKCQFLVQGGGENLINAHLAKDNAQGANDALKLLLDGAKQAGVDTTPLNLLRGKVQEAAKDFSSAAASYKTVLDAGSSDADSKAAAELGIARCLWGQKKSGEAEAKYRALVSRELPALVLAGAWNGLGDIMFQNGRAKPDADLITDALYAYLRGCVLYVPASGESTGEYERAVRGAHDCFKALSEIETKDDRKKAFAARSRERLDHLQTKFPNSPYLPDRK